MIITLLETNDQLMQTWLAYAVVGVIALFITYFFCRWIFSISERVRQNEIIINLLVLIARKQGATDGDIIAARKATLKT